MIFDDIDRFYGMKKSHFNSKLAFLLNFYVIHNILRHTLIFDHLKDIEPGTRVLEVPELFLYNDKDETDE